MASRSRISRTLLNPMWCERQLQRRILREAVEVPRHDDLLHHVPQLQQRLEVDVIVMAVGDQHVVDGLRQILEGEAVRFGRHTRS